MPARGSGRLKLLSQNVRGLSDAHDTKLRVIMQRMIAQRVDVAVLQETWIFNSKVEQIEGPDDELFTLIRHGEPKRKGRARGGVAILLSPNAAQVWDQQPRPFGIDHRLLAIRLVPDGALPVTVGCGYAPTSSHPAAERDRFHDDIQQLESSTPASDLLLIGMDANASVGVGPTGGVRALRDPTSERCRPGAPSTTRRN